MPAAVDASTTAGGGTRNGKSARTTTCAHGRYTYSQRYSVPSRALRDCASVLPKQRSLFDRLAGAARSGGLGRDGRELAAIRVTIAESDVARAWYEGPVR